MSVLEYRDPKSSFSRKVTVLEILEKWTKVSQWRIPSDMSQSFLKIVFVF